MNRALVAIGLVIERLTKQQWFVFLAATLIALAPAMFLYDQANRSTDEMHRFAEGFTGRVFQKEHAPAEHHVSALAAKSEMSTLEHQNGSTVPPDRDLQEVIESWGKLPVEIRQAMLLIVRHQTGAGASPPK